VKEGIFLLFVCNAGLSPSRLWMVEDEVALIKLLKIEFGKGV
jgi:hypothetical protein